MALVSDKRVLITISVDAAHWERFDDWLAGDHEDMPEGVDAVIVSYEESK